MCVAATPEGTPGRYLGFAFGRQERRLARWPVSPRAASWMAHLFCLERAAHCCRRVRAGWYLRGSRARKGCSDPNRRIASLRLRLSQNRTQAQHRTTRPGRTRSAGGAVRHGGSSLAGKRGCTHEHRPVAIDGHSEARAAVNGGRGRGSASSDGSCRCSGSTRPQRQLDSRRGTHAASMAPAAGTPVPAGPVRSVLASHWLAVATVCRDPC